MDKMYIRGSIYKQLVDELDKRTVRPVNRAIGEGSFETFKEVLDYSPIDTGRFRAAWRLTLDRPTRSTPKEPTPAQRSENISGKDMFSSELMAARAQANKSSQTFTIMKHKAIVLSNNVSYSTSITKLSERNAGKMTSPEIERFASSRMDDLIQSKLGKIK
jgi:hypothetical protein